MVIWTPICNKYIVRIYKVNIIFVYDSSTNLITCLIGVFRIGSGRIVVGTKVRDTI